MIPITPVTTEYGLPIQLGIQLDQLAVLFSDCRSAMRWDCLFARESVTHGLNEIQRGHIPLDI